MAKLKQLIGTVARTLGDPEVSVNVLAMELRKAGLIRSTGRGRNAAEMTPKDAASLLISCLAGGYATETAKTTLRILSSMLEIGTTKILLERVSRSGNNIDISQWDNKYLTLFHELHDLGFGLETVIKNITDDGWPHFQGKPLHSTRLTIQRHPAIVTTTLDFNFNGMDSLALYYELEQEGAYHLLRSGEDDIAPYRDDDDQRPGYKVTIVRIGSSAFSSIATCLRGHRMDRLETLPSPASEHQAA